MSMKGRKAGSSIRQVSPESHHIQVTFRPGKEATFVSTVVVAQVQFCQLRARSHKQPGRTIRDLSTKLRIAISVQYAIS
eukprot:1198803-Rhodomonas_salina.1